MESSGTGGYVQHLCVVDRSTLGGINSSWPQPASRAGEKRQPTPVDMHATLTSLGTGLESQQTTSGVGDKANPRPPLACRLGVRHHRPSHQCRSPIRWSRGVPLTINGFRGMPSLVCVTTHQRPHECSQHMHCPCKSSNRSGEHHRCPHHLLIIRPFSRKPNLWVKPEHALRSKVSHTCN